MKFNIGIMQGRLSPLVSKRIQSFPSNNWKREMIDLKSLGISILEWTVDQDFIELNPIMSENGILEIKHNMYINQITIPSLTADFVMQSPFWKTSGSFYNYLMNQLRVILINSSILGVKTIVIPLVDNGRVENAKQEMSLKNGFESLMPLIEKNDLFIAFESDLPPIELKSFIESFNNSRFGINYDTGNSAALGYRIDEEFDNYSSYIFNVHIKDRFLNGSTTALGQGYVDFAKLHYLLLTCQYKYNLVLQTARDPDGDHLGCISNYLQFLSSYDIDFK